MKLNKWMPIQLIHIQGDSMYPTLHKGETYLSVPFSLSEPKIGDIVIAKYNRLTIVKRIADIEHYEPYCDFFRDHCYKHRDKFYLLGDNPEKSIDSRHYGTVECQYIYRTLWKPTIFTKVCRRLKNE